MPPRILITGATGFIGRFLTESLLANGFEVRAAARDVSQISARPDLDIVSLPDMSEPHDWHALLGGVTHVVHLAGIAHATSTIPESQYMAVNCEATRALAIAAREADLNRVVLMSSVRAQSGPSAEGVLTERSPPHPTDAYGRSKLAAEQALAEELADSRTDWVALRPVVVYGPGVKGNMAALVRLARLPIPLPLKTVAGRRSLLHIDSLMTAVRHVLTSPQASRRVFLVADEEPATVPEILAALRSGLSRSPGLVPIPAGILASLARLAGRTGQWQRLNADLVVDAAQLQGIGWHPCHDTAKALASCLNAE
ncbi:NAD-dependent epimerase/dehydratase [Candidatus Filomicrobium marinum]|uniref:NAD-dependent epimerase/dehydratase n=3 Tax=Hyphomicrobiaceae TaxID=45401 RepID=A0A0D6JEU2_9HYPH|nr:NAD-dependent epimerase/dehydratase family protein [Candidatus Filomicrobium marinum]MCV0370264.1 NAD-dependent epimerase/dehydratase family protein [Filomicrobium sp.]CFX23154.1 NAD-dependent epimerase/dehydratase [Candidatus Filomicrobium marinum]CPR19004.1 NAD-dependent epimerase/dehydratase [Candidatus Filomicrobium marinum]SDO11364.1 UDP-glucose 4-epimerase [Filomicrobium insigne]